MDVISKNKRDARITVYRGYWQSNESEILYVLCGAVSNKKITKSVQQTSELAS